MRENEKIIRELKRVVKNAPEVELGKFIHYITSFVNGAYGTDDEIVRTLEDYNELLADKNGVYTVLQYEKEWYTGDRNKRFDFSKENEQIAYNRYITCADERGYKFLNLEERLTLNDFNSRNFGELIVDMEESATVINHSSVFWYEPLYRHMQVYVVARIQDKYVAMHRNIVENGFTENLSGEELFYYVSEGLSVEFPDLNGKQALAKSVFDEWIVIVFDFEGSPQVVDYADKVFLGVYTRPNVNEIEIYNPNQAIEIFHEWMQKSNLVLDFDKRTVFDDGTVSFEKYKDVRKCLQIDLKD